MQMHGGRVCLGSHQYTWAANVDLTEEIRAECGTQVTLPWAVVYCYTGYSMFKLTSLFQRNLNPIRRWG